jgi:magnesium chelatase family protein
MPVPTLDAPVAHLRGEAPITPAPEGEDLAAGDDERPGGDLADVKGQEHARRALEVATGSSASLACVLARSPPSANKCSSFRRSALPRHLPPSRTRCGPARPTRDGTVTFTS